MSYIVPRDKPNRCTNCMYMDRITYDCKLMYGDDYPDFEAQYNHCPLIEIPTPHGVLKDTTAFDERIRDQYCKKCERRFGIKNGKRKEVYEIGGVPCRACDIGDMLDWLDDAETVIKAEGSET